MVSAYRVCAILSLAAGSLLGGLAAATNDNPTAASGAATPKRSVTTAASCSDQRATKAELLALAAHNQAATEAAEKSGKQPNILVIWGDDIGLWNISHINRGMMGYTTPNIDRIAREGIYFTDYYGQQSCTAGRSAFLAGNVPLRTGMTKAGLPGAKEGWNKADVTIATVMRAKTATSLRRMASRTVSRAITRTGVMALPAARGSGPRGSCARARLPPPDRRARR